MTVLVFHWTENDAVVTMALAWFRFLVHHLFSTCRKCYNNYTYLWFLCQYNYFFKPSLKFKNTLSLQYSLFVTHKAETHDTVWQVIVSSDFFRDSFYGYLRQLFFIHFYVNGWVCSYFGVTFMVLQHRRNERSSQFFVWKTLVGSVLGKICKKAKVSAFWQIFDVTVYILLYLDTHCAYW